MKTNNILDVSNLNIYPRHSKTLKLVDDISFNIPKGKVTCIVGESGSGKSLTALSIIQLLSVQLDFDGVIDFEKSRISQLPESKLRDMRGLDIAMIFQDPMTSLNPVFTVGYQVLEAVLAHRKISKSEAKNEVIKAFDDVGIPADRYDSFPDELSGGQRQRIMIAMAIINNPKLLIADEPTTALDVTVQKQILDLINNLQKKFNMSVLFITHDFGVVQEIADQVLVMYKGKIVESGNAKKVINLPNHPYTKALLNCIPSLKSSKKLSPINYKKLDQEMAKL
jgi:ABC-type dipeptide/oligopeptide/nickel transport system ATPase component